MRKVFVLATLAVASLGFTACNSDDDNTTTNPMIGEWKAQTLSYVRPDNGQTMTHDFSLITGGCDVDELELRQNNTADLEREGKIDEVCVESHTAGTWNENSVTIEGETAPREVISVSATELVLKYNMTWQFGNTDVTVKYTKS